MSFAYYDPANIQFGVCRGPLMGGDCVLVPVHNNVKRLLQDMVNATREGMTVDGSTSKIPQFELSQEYGSGSRAVLPLSNRLASDFRQFYNRENLPIDAEALTEPQTVSAYFCIWHDRADNKLIAIKRASQFKAVLRARLIRLIDDSLHAVDDKIFKLDSDFDVLIVDGRVYIHSVPAFEQLADLDKQIKMAAVENIKGLEDQMPGIAFGKLSDYVAGHKRAARIVAALCSRPDLAETSVTNLRRECQRNSVSVKTIDGKLCPSPGSELAFLQMLDRRRYVISLVAGRWEQYEAGSRKGVGIHERASDGHAIRTKKMPE